MGDSPDTAVLSILFKKDLGRASSGNMAALAFEWYCYMTLHRPPLPPPSFLSHAFTISGGGVFVAARWCNGYCMCIGGGDV